MQTVKILEQSKISHVPELDFKGVFKSDFFSHFLF